MTTDTTRRERKAAERRQRILEAGAQVFTERGYHRATTKEIADVADVAEGTLYNYFASKDDLLMGILDDLVQLNRQQALMTEGLEMELGEFLRAFLAYRLARTGPYQRLLVSILPELMHHPALRERYNRDLVQPALAMIEAHIQGRVAHGQLPAVDAPLVTRMIVGMLFGMQLLMIVGDPHMAAVWAQPGQMIDSIAGLILQGVDGLPPPALGHESDQKH